MDLDYFKKTFTFSHDNGVPLYTQLASYIQMQIKMGALKPGDRILPESSICEALNVSRDC
jgi:DNA-binding GntR family transcriptional regulator